MELKQLDCRALAICNSPSRATGRVMRAYVLYLSTPDRGPPKGPIATQDRLHLPEIGSKDAPNRSKDALNRVPEPLKKN